MREDKHVEVVRRLTDATRARRLEWRPLSVGDYTQFTAVLPSRQSFALGRGEAPDENRNSWYLDVRDRTGVWVDRIEAQPVGGDRELDALMGELVATVEEAAASGLDDTIVALQELTKSLH